MTSAARNSQRPRTGASLPGGRVSVATDGSGPPDETGEYPATSELLDPPGGEDPANPADPAEEHRAYPDRSSAAQELARDDLQARVAAYLTKGRPRVVVTDNVHTMLSVKRGQDVWTLRLHHMFTGAPPVVVRAVARYAEKQCPDASRVLRRFIDANDTRIRRRKGPRAVQIDVEGRHHNLQDLFDELNDAYFANRIEARITWGPRTRRRRGRESIKLGSYTVEDKLIRIHPVLDAADVPAWFVAYIVFHEMLHEVHEMPLVDGRRIYHTREFRRDEQKFEHYDRAIAWEKANLHKLLDR